ncbi:tetratricopeptide repeat protein [Micromonospora arborensis]|uniref:tetratricopeptide repeat protein n=1 Tax=Micromonospora arborensis TaxID=2116518 RepID=UPI003721A17A
MLHQDSLAKVLGEVPADAVRAAFRDRNLTIRPDPSGWKAHGFTGAKLVAVVVEHACADNEVPQRCIAKVSPPSAAVPENAQHAAANQHGGDSTFTRDHMVAIAFDPVRCPTGEIVSFQHLAGIDFDSMTVLSRVRDQQLADVCRQVRRGLLEEWTGRAFQVLEMTVPELLRSELGDLASSWVVSADTSWIMTDDDGAFPNPLALLNDDALLMARPEPRIVGHVHGDLHQDNILVPENTGRGPSADRYRLVDLATFRSSAPLTRDLATLLISLIAHRVKKLDQAAINGLLQFVPAPGNQPTDAPTDLASVIQALSDPGEAPFASTWRGPWNKQMRVSLLAQAVRHSTYESVGPTGRWWCLRLAGLLARGLLPNRRPDVQPARLIPEMFAVAGGSSALPIRPIIDHEGTRKQLREALEHPGPAVTLLLGSAGVGKSVIARAVAAELRIHGVRVVEHHAAAVRRPDAMTLVEGLEEETSDDRLRPGETVHVRLNAALDALDRPVVIMIDQAEVLLDKETGAVVDIEFDQALETIATTPGRMAKVLLVTGTRPSSALHCTWPSAAKRVEVEGLRQPHFGRLLRVLNESVGTGLTGLTRSQTDVLRHRLGGNPSFAWLAQVIVQSVGSEYGAGALVDELAARPPAEVPRFLADTFKRQLHDHARRLLAALAAFGTPVEPDAIAALVQQWLPAQHAISLLQKLADQQLVTMVGGLYSLSPSDPYQMLGEPSVDDEVWRQMLWTAARELGSRLKADEDVTGVDDLHRHLALIDVLRRAGRYEAALSMMDHLDILLRRWDSEALLLGRREHIRNLLTDPRPKMLNLNSLGDLYRSRGRLGDAIEAFQDALSIAVSEGTLLDRLSIQINMAATHWDLGETEKAADLFGLALSEADLRGVLECQLAASEGLADCHRRWGNYRQAIPLAQRALNLAQVTGSNGTVSIALKLARWSAELGELADAERRIAEAREEADYQPDSTLRTACEDARADLLLDYGRPDEALILADEVLARARRQRSLLVQLQAQTIRCMAYLRIEPVDLLAAQAAIDAANRIRRKRRSLIVPALRALAFALDGRNEEARRCFEDLQDEAERRGRDPQDVTALQMLGFAHCWRAGNSDSALGSAVDAFRAARDCTDPPAKGTEELLTFLVRQLETCGGHPGRLGPVLDAISGATLGPGH